jgi:predicted nucleic acid-binding protein
MQKPRPFLDSSVIIRGLLYPSSNSGVILKLVTNGEVLGVVNVKVTKEVTDVLKRIKNKDFASNALIFMNSTFEIVGKEVYSAQMNELRGKIKDKDLEHISTVKALNLTYLVAYDRDFESFPEYKIPKDFLMDIGIVYFDRDW